MDEIILAAYAEQFPAKATGNTNIIVALKIDWGSLRYQKQWLLSQPGAASDGILAILDAIQDQAVANKRATEEEVFGSSRD